MAPKCFETSVQVPEEPFRITLRARVAAMRVLFLIRREQALNYRARGQSVISAEVERPLKRPIA